MEDALSSNFNLTISPFVNYSCKASSTHGRNMLFLFVCSGQFVTENQDFVSSVNQLHVIMQSACFTVEFTLTIQTFWSANNNS